MFRRVKMFVLLGLIVVAGTTTQTKGRPLNDPSVVGQWTTFGTLPYKAVHVNLLPSGQKVFFWPSFAVGDNPQLWDIASGTTSPAAQAGWNVFCAGHSYLPDGRLFVAGGHANSCPYGLANAAIYDPSSDSWTQLPNMNAGRWYPTVTTLSNGDMLVLAGTIDPTTGQNPLPQVWQAAAGTWRDLTSAQLLLPQYPRMFLAPNGKVVSVGPYNNTRYLDTSGTGKWGAVFAKSQFGTRSYGSALLYDVSKIIIVGGGDPPTATAEIIDLNAATPSWQSTASMAYARRQLNATLLPDGKIFVTGGSSGSGFDNNTAPVYPTEMWDPATGQWTTIASINVYRGYHGTAVLLPDGRVFSAGGEKSPNSGEIFSPPYLFKGQRPTITSAPSSASYGSTISLVTPDAADITKVTLLRIGSVTHAFNMNQAVSFLSFTKVAGSLSATVPSNRNWIPPGHYMLFILNSKGVPSLAKLISIS